MQTPTREEQESNPHPPVFGFCASNTETVQASNLPKDTAHNARLQSVRKFHTYVRSLKE